MSKYQDFIAKNAPTSVKMELVGADAWNDMIDQLYKSYKNPQDFYNALGQWYTQEQRKTWASSGSYVKEPWRPNSPKWREMKLAKGFSGQPNVMSGKTRDAMTGRSPSGAKERKSKKEYRIMLTAYKNPMTGKRFHNAKHGTSHPFYIIDYYRPIQFSKLTPLGYKRLYDSIKPVIEAKDKEIQRAGKAVS